ncbi:hypothetical protein [Thalassobacillus devorans]|uniref:hypothetical protein n=1 Tax=Thalassobacillus devorans TaxID=279813 RepID=UPI00111C362C|nr:hypothetical protein [Thalassobacillus devorans]
MKHQELDFMLDSLLDTKEEFEIKEYPKYRYGKKIVDDNGDYMIVYYHQEIEKVVYTFKGVEDIYFTLYMPKQNTKVT